MQGYDLTVLVKVTTRPAYGSDHAHFMMVRDAIQTALDKLVKNQKIHPDVKIETVDGSTLALADSICSTIEAKVEERATKLEDEFKDRIRALVIDRS